MVTMLGVEDYEEILQRLSSASNTETLQVVHRYKGRRLDSGDQTTEVTIEILRGPGGFIVEAWSDKGRRALAGSPSWDLEDAIAATDWAGLDAPTT